MGRAKLTDLFRRAKTAAELQALCEAEVEQLRDLQGRLGEAQAARMEALVQEQLGNGSAATAKAAVTSLQEQVEEAEARVEAVRRKVDEAEGREAAEEAKRLTAAAAQLKVDYDQWKQREIETKIQASKHSAQLTPLRGRETDLRGRAQRLRERYPEVPPVLINFAVEPLGQADFQKIREALGTA